MAISEMPQPSSGAALVYHDEVWPAVAVQVGYDNLIAHFQGVCNHGLPPLRQFCAWQRRNQQKQEEQQHQTNLSEMRSRRNS